MAAGIQGIPAVFVFWRSSIRFSLQQARCGRKPVVFPFFCLAGNRQKGEKMVCFLVGKAKICGKIKFSRPNPFIFIDESRFFVYNS